MVFHDFSKFWVLTMLLLMAIGISACSSGQAKDVDIQYSGGRDVLALARAVQDDFFAGSGYTLGETPSKNKIEDLKKGKLDLVLLGREPTPEELEGLTDTIVAYDAVVLVVSTRTYIGGEYWIPQGTSEIILKDLKFGGLTNIEMSDLKALYEFRLGLSKTAWHPKVPLYQFVPSRGGDAAIIPLTTSTPPEYQGSWAVGQANMPGYIYKPAEYDLQTALLQKIGLEDPDPKAALSFTASHLQSEEELLAQIFKIEPDLATPNSNRFRFDLFLQPFSRNVVVRAFQHGFSIQALTVDNIDPISDPKRIYDGTYPLSRRIHILTANPAPEPVAALVEYMKSPDGQARISEIEFLPLP